MYSRGSGFPGAHHKVWTKTNLLPPLDHPSTSRLLIHQDEPFKWPFLGLQIKPDKCPVKPVHLLVRNIARSHFKSQALYQSNTLVVMNNTHSDAEPGPTVLRIDALPLRTSKNKRKSISLYFFKCCLWYIKLHINDVKHTKFIFQYKCSFVFKKCIKIWQ